MRFCGIAMILLALVSCQEDTKQKIELNTDEQKFSYSLGYTIGKDMSNGLKRQGINPDPDAFSQGVSDVLKGGDALLTDAEIKEVMESYKEKMMAMQIEGGPDEAVVSAISIFRIAYYRMRDVCHMFSDLVHAAGFGIRANQGKTGGRMFAHRFWQLNRGLPDVFGDGLGRCLPGTFAKGPVYSSAIRCVPSTDGKIGFLDQAFFEQPAHFACSLGTEGK